MRSVHSERALVFTHQASCSRFFSGDLLTTPDISVVSRFKHPDLPRIYRGRLRFLRLWSTVNFCEQVKIRHRVQQDLRRVFESQDYTKFFFDGILKFLNCLLTDHRIIRHVDPIRFKYAFSIFCSQKKPYLGQCEEDINRSKSRL